jgi:sugar lactone lactonase YvrE
MITRTLVLCLLVACDRGELVRSYASVAETPELSTQPPPYVAPIAIDVSTGLASPEAIVYDPQADVYLVSNIHGDPMAKDGNGYISRVSPNGTMLVRKWIDGTQPGVHLDGPRGMVLDATTLYVADVDAVRLFDRETGEPKASWPVPDAAFPNDLRLDEEGRLLVTDTGIELTGAGPQPKGTSAIWRYDHDGHPTAIARGDELEGPNGIAVTPRGLAIAAFMGKDVYFWQDGQKQVLATFPTGELDGLVQLPDGSFLVTSWEARGIYRVFPDGKWQLAFHDADLIGPASIEYDPVRGRVLIPLVKASALRFEPYSP